MSKKDWSADHTKDYGQCYPEGTHERTVQDILAEQELVNLLSSVRQRRLKAFTDALRVVEAQGRAKALAECSDLVRKKADLWNSRTLDALDARERGLPDLVQISRDCQQDFLDIIAAIWRKEYP